MTTFEPFELQHLAAACATVAFGLIPALMVRRHCTPASRGAACKVTAIVLVAYLVPSLAIKTVAYHLPVSENLPLHICGASIVLGAIMLWLPSYRLFEVVYFWGIGGTLAALITPDLPHGFPHPLFLLFFAGHGASLSAVAFGTLVCGFRPRPASVAVALIATALYALVLFPLNFLLGSNYLYLMHKPTQPSIIDYFGSWPWYIIGMAVVAIAACLLCYLPYAIRDRLVQ